MARRPRIHYLLWFLGQICGDSSGRHLSAACGRMPAAVGLSCRSMSQKYPERIGALSRCKNVLVTTHVRPDGDALGTAAAMVMGMGARGIAAEVLLLSALPTKYAFVFHDNAIPFHEAEAGWPAGLDLDRFDALL